MKPRGEAPTCATCYRQECVCSDEVRERERLKELAVESIYQRASAAVERTSGAYVPAKWRVVQEAEE